MTTEIEVNPSGSFLLCSYLFTDELIGKVKQDVKTFMFDRVKDNVYFEFINWQRSKNEIAALTMYSFADILLPKRFDTIFQVDNTENYVHTEFAITQAIINGWTPVGQIEKGHKHIVVIQFAESIPDIFNLLSNFNVSENVGGQIQLAFCDKVDFDSIKVSIKHHSA